MNRMRGMLSPVGPIISQFANRETSDRDRWAECLPAGGMNRTSDKSGGRNRLVCPVRQRVDHLARRSPSHFLATPAAAHPAAGVFVIALVSRPVGRRQRKSRSAGSYFLSLAHD